MGRKKKSEILEGGLKETNLVQKSRPLFSLWSSGMSLAEFKILDTYLSRIDSHKPEQRTVKLYKGELEQLFGVSQIKVKDLDKRLDGLFRGVPVVKEDNELDKIALFARAQCAKDEKTGLWAVVLTCTPEAMKYIFNIEALGYLRYKIRSVTKLKSLYSYILFQYIECNRYRVSWTVELDELKEILHCTADLYSEFKRFNEKILKAAQSELEEKTELRFAYTPIRKGRKIFAIEFIPEPLKIELDDVNPNQVTLDDFGVSDEAWEKLELFGNALGDEFSRLQVEQVFQIICRKPFPNPANGLDIERYHYLARMYAELNAQAEQKKKDGSPIRNRFKYLVKMLENDCDL